jgi:hypothetical protein
MKKFVLLFFIISSIMFSQQHYECGMTESYTESYPKGYQLNSPQIGGQSAPAKTLNGSYVRIFCVFAQFSGDTKDPNDVNWQVNQMPTWANTFIGTNINQAPYPVNTLSNYFHQMSNGTNHIIGYVYPTLVTINAPSTQYYGTSNLAVLQAVDQNINFNNFDQWNMMSSYQQTFNQTDNYVDAVYIIWRNIDYGTWGGIARLGTTYTTNDGVIISDRIPTISMTLDIGGKSDYTFENKLGLLAHEYGHYLYGAYHNFELAACSGTAQRGLGLMPAWAGSLAMNPQEKYLLGYTTYSDIFYDQTGQLSDFQSTGYSYRIPIPVLVNGVPNINPSEFFVIANHQKITTYEQTKSTGIYIYHVKNNYYGQNHMDMIAADGLWEWSVIDWITPVGLGGSGDWYCVNYPDRTDPAKLPITKRLSVDRVNGRDELQEVVRAQYLQPGPFYGRYYWWDKWYNESGGRVESPIGDIEDAFNIGYNQLFSTFSNPPTYDKYRTQTNTAVELISNNNNQFNLQFYTSEASVLNAPPSKPQNLQVAASSTNHPELTWEENIEDDKNYYKIYKYNNSEFGWQFLGIAATPYYQDVSVSYCTPGQFCPERTVRYRVTCIDTQSKESVPSDSVMTSVRGFAQEKIIANPSIANLPSEYSLSANFPNPFNPSTKISYSIKEEVLVTLKIYDVLGKEIATLVKENKPSGNYEAEFDASQLPSGMYIYKLQAGSFISSKKMLLLK